MYLRSRMYEKINGGELEDYARENYGRKASNASRRLRELCEENLIKREVKENLNSKVKSVWYWAEPLEIKSYYVQGQKVSQKILWQPF